MPETAAAPAPTTALSATPPPTPRRRLPAEHGGDRLALAVASATLGLRGADRGALARRMRLSASAVLLFAAGTHRLSPPEAGHLRRAAALRALKRLAAQVALAERLGYLDPPAALALLEEQTAVRLALIEPAVEVAASA